MSIFKFVNKHILLVNYIFKLKYSDILNGCELPLLFDYFIGQVNIYMYTQSC